MSRDVHLINQSEVNKLTKIPVVSATTSSIKQFNLKDSKNEDRVNGTSHFCLVKKMDSKLPTNQTRNIIQLVKTGGSQPSIIQISPVKSATKKIIEIQQRIPNAKSLKFGEKVKLPKNTAIFPSNNNNLGTTTPTIMIASPKQQNQFTTAHKQKQISASPKHGQPQALFVPNSQLNYPPYTTSFNMKNNQHPSMVVHTPSNQYPASSPLRPTPYKPSPRWNAASPNRNKRPSSVNNLQMVESKRRRTPINGEKSGKGLRHFAQLVCEKVKQKVTTTYNEVADELVSDYAERQKLHNPEQNYDQKNIRRRVYDALNVLMAMNIIYKDKKDIHWVGLPTNSAQEVQALQSEKIRREQSIAKKTNQLQELIIQQIAFRSLVERNKRFEEVGGPPNDNSSIQLPFIIVNTSKKTVIDCSISNDKYEYLFNFNNTFEIHDDIEVLKRMGMAYNLDSPSKCSLEDLKQAVKLVPANLKPYLEGMAGFQIPEPSNNGQLFPAIFRSEKEQQLGSDAVKREAYDVNNSSKLDATDREVAMVTTNVLQRQVSSRSSSAMTSLNDVMDDGSTMTSSISMSSEESLPGNVVVSPNEVGEENKSSLA